MKKRGILFTLLTALCLLFFLTACGGTDGALTGTWEAELDVSDLLEEYWQEQGISLAVEEKLYIQLELVFGADGSCSMYFDETDSWELAEKYFAAVQADLLRQVYEGQEAEGFSREETDASFAAIGSSTEAMVGTLLAEPREMLETLLTESEAIESGVYRVKDGMLYMEQDKKALKDSANGLSYVLEGDCLTLQFGEGSLLGADTDSVRFYRL